MNIIYFTTAQETSDYKHFLSLWSTPINSSNQTFHNKLIRSLANVYHIDVISIRPYSKHSCSTKGLNKNKKIDGNINWHYLSIPSNKLFKYSHCKVQINNIFMKLDKDSIIISDTINPTVLALSTKFANKYKLPIIGVCTDSPSNISGTSRRYTLFCLKLSKQLDGYITLTTELNELFNEKRKPALVIEGIVENDIPSKKTTSYGDYLFYAGTLLPRYGIYNLIEAYKQLNDSKHKLVIAGHSGDNEKIKSLIKGNENIIFLGNIPNSEVLSLEASSWANINPRPYSEDLDRYSIPSKVLEYFNSGSPTISVKNTKLQKLYFDCAIWSKSGSVDDLLNSIKLLSSLDSEQYKLLASKSREITHKYFSIESLSIKLESFLYLLRKNNQ